MQYGAWLRGEPSRRGSFELPKLVTGGAPENGKVAAGGGTEKGVAKAQILENHTEVGRAYVEKLIGREDNPNALGESTLVFSDQSEEVLYGKERGVRE